MKIWIFLIIVLLGVMELVGWWVYQEMRTKEEVPVTSSEAVKPPSSEASREEIPERASEPARTIPLLDQDIRKFPIITKEVVAGRTERTIHMGVRQWAWDPAALTVKQDELVRLVAHNADIQHGLVIPDLGVNADIPPEGAVIEFIPEKRGTFEFFCSVWCGEGHMEMRGKITVE